MRRGGRVVESGRLAAGHGGLSVSRPGGGDPRRSFGRLRRAAFDQETGTRHPERRQSPDSVGGILPGSMSTRFQRLASRMSWNPGSR
jgi:hypothetical protein